MVTMTTKWFCLYVCVNILYTHICKVYVCVGVTVFLEEEKFGSFSLPPLSRVDERFLKMFSMQIFSFFPWNVVLLKGKRD